MGHSRRKRPTSGATLVRYRLARRWNPISSPSFDYQAGIPGCDGLAGVSPQHAAQASLRTGSRLHHIPAQARAAPPNGRKMGHDPSLTIEKWAISGENDPLVGRRLYDNAGPTAHARLAVMPFISSRQTPAATGFSAPVSCPLRPRITQRGLVLLHVLADRREPGRRPIDGSNSVPIGPKMGRPRRERPIGGGIACTTAPGLPLAADSQSCHTFPACKPGGDGLLSTSLKRLEAFHRSEVLRFAARRIRPMRTRRTPQQWVNLRSNPSQHGSFPPGTTR